MPASWPDRLGPFRVGAPLGAGGAGEVRAGEHVRTGVAVALKRLAGADATAFHHEVRAVAGLSHPAIVALWDAGEDDAGPWLAMERATSTLADLDAPLTWPEARAVLARVLAALGHAHAHGVLHRDLKPANVLLGCRRDPAEVLAPRIGGLRLADWGIASVGGRTPARATRAWAAPEQLAGAPDAQGPWTDLYACGRLADWLLAGRAASPALQAWLAALRHPDPAARPRHAADARAALLALPDDALGAGGPAPASPAPAAPAGDTATAAVLSPLAPPPAPRGTPPPLPPAPWPPERPRPPRRWSSVPLVDTGLGLLHLRPLPLRGREPLQDRLWSALCAVHERQQPRHLCLVGPPGVGRRRLVRWLATTAAACGVADLHDGATPPTVADRPVIWRATADAPPAEGPVLTLSVCEDSVCEDSVCEDAPPAGAEAVAVPPLSRGSLVAILREAGRLTVGLAVQLAEEADGRPGAAREALLSLVRDDRLESRPDGFRLRVTHPLAPADQPRFEALVAAAAADLAAGRAQDAARSLEQARCLGAAPPALDRRRRLVALRAMVGGDTTLEAGLAHADALVAEARAADEPVLAARALAARAGLLYDAAQAPRARADVAAARALAPGDPEVAYECDLLDGYMLADPQAACAALERARAGRPADRSTVAPLAALAGRSRELDLDRALRFARMAVDAADAEGTSPQRRVVTRVSLANALLHAGRFAEALAPATAGVALAEDAGLRAPGAWCQLARGSALRRLDRLDEARDAYLAAIAGFRLTSTPDHRIRLNLALVELARGDREGLRGLARSVAEVDLATLQDIDAACVAMLRVLGAAAAADGPGTATAVETFATHCRDAGIQEPEFAQALRDARVLIPDSAARDALDAAVREQAPT